MSEDTAKKAMQADSRAPARRAAPGMPLLRIEAVVKKFGSSRAVDGLSLDIPAGQFFALSSVMMSARPALAWNLAADLFLLNCARVR